MISAHTPITNNIGVTRANMGRKIGTDPSNLQKFNIENITM